MTSQDEWERQVTAFREAKHHAAQIGLPIVAVTPHTAMCVLHYIEELDGELDANERTICELHAHIKTWQDKVGILDGELAKQHRRVSELERQVDNEYGEYMEMQERMS